MDISYCVDAQPMNRLRSTLLIDPIGLISAEEPIQDVSSRFARTANDVHRMVRLYPRRHADNLQSYFVKSGEVISTFA